MKLNEFLKDKPQVDLEITQVVKEITDNGELTAKLYLKKPIPEVTSGTVRDPETGEMVPRVQFDVTMIRIHQRNMDNDGIDINEDGTGTVKADLRLEISRRGEVWLTNESFGSFARKQRATQNAEGNGAVIAKMKERQAAKELEGVDAGKPETVASGAGAAPAGAKKGK